MKMKKTNFGSFFLHFKQHCYEPLSRFWYQNHMQNQSLRSIFLSPSMEDLINNMTTSSINDLSELSFFCLL